MTPLRFGPSDCLLEDITTIAIALDHFQNLEIIPMTSSNADDISYVKSRTIKGHLFFFWDRGSSDTQLLERTMIQGGT